MLKPRKRLVKAKLKEDKLLIFTAKVQAWAVKYQRQILVAVGAVAAAAVLFSVLRLTAAAAERNAAYQSFLARDAFLRDDLDEALAKAGQVIDAYPRAPSAGAMMLLKARILEMRAQFGDVLPLYQQVAKRFRDHPYLAFSAWNSMGAFYWGREEYSRAGECYLQAATKYPDHFHASGALVDAGKAFRKAGRLDDARRCLRLVLTKYPKSRAVTAAREELEQIEFQP